jgi:plasmid maintenance system antidote protein VapI
MLKDELEHFESLPTTKEWLMLLKHKRNNCSDYQAAKILGITQPSMSNLMSGKNVMSDETAIKIAKELNVSPILLVMSATRERTKSEELKVSIDSIKHEILKASCYILISFSLSLFHLAPYFS